MTHNLLAGTGNVLRFPFEERARPTLDLMRDLAPDCRVVDLTAEAFDLPLPDVDFRHRVDAETAEHILNHIDPRPGKARNMALRTLRDRAVDAAVQAARAWRRASVAADDARRHVAQARTDGGFWMNGLRREALERDAAALLLEAYLQCEAAEGVARAVRLALGGEEWIPFDIHREAETLFCGSP